MEPQSELFQSREIAGTSSGPVDMESLDAVVTSRTLNYAELTEYIHRVEQRYPHIVNVESLGTSPQGREVWLVTVGNNVEEQPDVASLRRGKSWKPTDDRPALYIDANIHATELTGSTACLALLKQLCDASSSDQGAQLLRNTTFYLVPRVSPDGAEHVITTGEFVRSSPLLYPHDERPSGLHAQDIDGDHNVFQMRIQDEAGGWRPSRDDPRVMVHRTPDDLDGPFYRVFAEGIFENFDGQVVKEARPAYGLDFNRNFPHNWKPETEQTGAGAFPLNNSETRGVASFFQSKTNIAAFMALHTGIEVLIPPEGAGPFSAFPDDDQILLHQLAAPAESVLKMPFQSLFEVDYGKVHGDFGEWVYESFGVPGFIVELWAPEARAGISLKEQLRRSRGFESAEPMDLAVARWLEQHQIVGQLRAWTAFVHPQVGPVELGGWRQGLHSRAPDGSLLAEIANRWVSYALWLARALPRIQVRSLDVKAIAPEFFRVGITLINAGMLATNLTRKALQRDVARPVVARLETGAFVTRVVGLEIQPIGHLEGYGGMGRAEWLVRAPEHSEITIRIEGHRAGSSVHTVRLVSGDETPPQSP